jgi:hypothetical protein
VGSYAALSVYQKRQGQRIREQLDAGQPPMAHPELLLPAYWDEWIDGDYAYNFTMVGGCARWDVL